MGLEPLTGPDEITVEGDDGTTLIENVEPDQDGKITIPASGSINDLEPGESTTSGFYTGGDIEDFPIDMNDIYADTHVISLGHGDNYGHQDYGKASIRMPFPGTGVVLDSSATKEQDGDFGPFPSEIYAGWEYVAEGVPFEFDAGDEFYLDSYQESSAYVIVEVDFDINV